MSTVPLLRADSWSAPLYSCKGGLAHLKILRQDAPSSLFISPTSPAPREDVFQDDASGFATQAPARPHDATAAAPGVASNGEGLERCGSGSALAVSLAGGLGSPLGNRMSFRQHNGLPQLSLPGVNMDDPFDPPAAPNGTGGLLDVLQRPPDTPTRPDSPMLLRTASGHLFLPGSPAKQASTMLQSPFAKQQLDQQELEQELETAAYNAADLPIFDDETDSGDSGIESFPSTGNNSGAFEAAVESGLCAALTPQLPQARSAANQHILIVNHRPAPLPLSDLPVQAHRAPRMMVRPRSLSRSLSRLGKAPVFPQGLEGYAQPEAGFSRKRSSNSEAEEEQSPKVLRLSPVAARLRQEDALRALRPLPEDGAGQGSKTPRKPRTKKKALTPPIPSEGTSGSPAADGESLSSARRRKSSPVARTGAGPQPRSPSAGASGAGPSAAAADRSPDPPAGHKKLGRKPKPRFPCLGCGREETPQWRYGPDRVSNMCNACGVRWKKNLFKPDHKRAILRRWEQVKNVFDYK